MCEADFTYDLGQELADQLYYEKEHSYNHNSYLESRIKNQRDEISHLNVKIRDLNQSVKYWKKLAESRKEVVHSKWVECSNELNKHCLNCGTVNGTIYQLPSFCEHCGAEMDTTKVY